MEEFLSYLQVDGEVARSKFRWLAEESMHAPLPWGWTAHRHPDTMETYYHHRPTQSSHYSHPLDGVCKEAIASMQSSTQRQRDAAEQREQLRLEADSWLAAQDSLALVQRTLATTGAMEEEAMALGNTASQLKKAIKAAKDKVRAATLYSDTALQQSFHCARNPKFSLYSNPRRVGGTSSSAVHTMAASSKHQRARVLPL